MIFDDLRKSISEMTTEELHEQMRQMRQRRRERPQPSPKKSKQASNIALYAKGIIPPDLNLDELIAAMESIIGDPK